MRWKGRYCENDAENWTKALQQKLNYDPKAAQNYDNGGCIKNNKIRNKLKAICTMYLKVHVFSFRRHLGCPQF